MKDGKKAAVGLVVAGLVTTGIILATRAKAAPPEGAGAEIGIVVLDAEGNPLPYDSPVSLTEGESYTVVVTVTNMTTKATVPPTPWEATFELVIQAATAYTALIPVTSGMEGFAAGQTRSFSFPMNVPLGSGGETGQIIALVNDPIGAEIVRATEPLTIITIEIIYGATVIIGV